ncbi:uncharacterized protein LOC123309213 [Coccinella septempunctata]|uniref:uncharacterized protein LOC123309213 n=1 Tax=Coccinella septempunctata TaxID=41139 RepID=UPI001D089778|nr:uncharacterized protein LOC123309213 [Coccinella septempunctata]XP_044748135.1 uncharacterized protein LOC123309213 [Coccinella septempunctata]
MAEAKEFIEKFHGLDGTLLKDRNKAFRLLLENYTEMRDNDNILKEIYINLHTNTYLEETYKLEFLIYFRRVSELFDLLKSGNDVSASRIIKQKWFLKAILKDVSPKEFVRDIFPQLSQIVRLKILKQILKQFKDEKYINSLFDELNETYGARPAVVIISGCSVDKIEEFLKERSLTISPAQLKLLYDKDKSLIRFYYAEYHKRGGNMNSLDSFSRYLARKDPALFMELREKYRFTTYFGLGRQGTKVFVKENTNALIEDPLKYLEMNVLKRSALVRQLGNEFPKFLKAAYPDSSKELSNSHLVFDLLDDYPKKRRYNLFSSLFKEVYNKDLFTAKEIMNEKLLEIIPSHEEREKWVDIFNSEVKYIKYKRSTVAVAELKEQLFRADDITFRKELFEYLITSCKVSEDYGQLLDILKLVCKRFRNADDGALYTLLRTINEKMDMKMLNEEHWKYIHEIIMLQDLRNITMCADIIFEYCKFLHVAEKSFEEMIPILLKCDTTLSSHKFVDERFKDDNFKKIFLQLVLKYYPALEDKFKSSWKAIEIVLIIRRWNRNHPKEKIFVSQVESIIESIQEEVKQSWVYCSGSEMQALKYLICVENDTEHFENIYFDNINTLANYTITRWFLKYKPEVFRKFIDKIYPCFTAKGKYLNGVLRKFEYSGLVKDIEEHYLGKLQEPDQSDRDVFAQILASIMPTRNFLALIEKYRPLIDKLDISNSSEEEKTLLQIEMSLAKSVRFSRCHHSALPVLLQYCKGDCLQPALYSLYSCFNRIAENNLKSVLSLLLKQPVSLRKHSMFLASLVFPVRINEDLGKQMMEAEKDISVKKHLFFCSYKYFLKNPLEHVWDILINYMELLTVHDKESLDLITNIHYIPEKFRQKFAEEVWQTLERLEEIENNPVDQYYDKFLLNIRDYDIRLLSPDFCITIIDKKMFKDGHKRNAICSKFAIQFMMYSGDIRQGIRSVMKILNEYKSKYWNTKKGAHAKSVIYHFCSEIFDECMSVDHLRIPLPKEFPSTLSEEWKKVFTQEETFEEYLLLECIIFKYGDDTDIQVFSKRIGELFERARKDYGELVHVLFRDILDNSLEKLLSDKKYKSELMVFLRQFIDDGPFSVARFLLVISLLPVRLDDEKLKKNYDYIVAKIRDTPDKIIRLSLDSHYKHF